MAVGKDPSMWVARVVDNPGEANWGDEEGASIWGGERGRLESERIRSLARWLPACNEGSSRVIRPCRCRPRATAKQGARSARIPLRWPACSKIVVDCQGLLDQLPIGNSLVMKWMTTDGQQA